MSDKDIFKIQHEKPKKIRQTIDRSYSRHDLTEEWQKSRQTEPGRQIINDNFIKFYITIILLIVIILISKLFYIQIIKGNEYLQASEGNRIRVQNLEAPRGIIYDRNGIPLVRNKPIFFLAYIPSDLEDDQLVERQLEIIAKSTNADIKELKKIIKENISLAYNIVPLIDSISYDQVVNLKTNLDIWTGFELGVHGSREYLYNESASHILGYLGKITKDDIASGKYDDYLLTDFVGKSGLEYYYENFLKGQAGSKEVEINVQGQIQKIIKEKKSISGSDLILTIDINIQNKLYDLLKEQLENMNLTKAAAVAIDPNNGEILAAVSLPSYNNNIFSGNVSLTDYQDLINNVDQPLFFRPLQGEYPSGSIFKPVIALAALENEIVTPQTTVFSQGGIQIASWFFPDWKAGGHGITNLTKALAESVNTYFFAIGGGYNQIDGLGIDKITEFAKKLFFTKKIGVDYPSEADGFLPSKKWKEEYKQERWYIGDTYNVSIGQGDVLITPMQITAFYTYLANGGTLYKPHFLKQVNRTDGTKENINKEILVKDLVKQKNIAAVRQGLRAAVEWGSATSLNIYSPYKIAGKTGTAQVGGDLEPHGWFVSFAPYENPTITLTILIENGTGGSTAAVPVARKFYSWYIENYNN